MVAKFPQPGTVSHESNGGNRHTIRLHPQRRRRKLEGLTMKTLIPRISRERKRHHGVLWKLHLHPRVRGTRARQSWNQLERNRIRIGGDGESCKADKR